MSETILPKDNAEPVLTTSAPTPDATRPQRTSGRGNGLAILALLFGAAGIAVAGWGVLQLRTLQSSHLQQHSQMEDIVAQTQALSQSEQQMSARLAQLPGASELEDRRRLVTQLQGDQQRLSQRLETVLGASR